MAEAEYKLSGSKMLDKWGYFGLVDNLINIYPMYSHNDIEKLTYEMVMNMLAFNKEKAYISSKEHENKS